ncbi:MAG: hypothetical protein Q8M08_01110 [Bacteroidales bacterium]|nr:hypothetical protein [Bacteroidales bacterium]
MSLKLYLDNCCFNRPFDDQTHIRIRIETEAKLHIQFKIVQKEFLLAWSYILDYENSMNPFIDRQTIIENWKNRSFKQVIENSTLLNNAKQIENLGVRAKDALHIACAIDANCDYFITTDDQILKKMNGCKLIKACNPIEIINLTEA